jgi:hypothetical protein|tara:strand:+ start:9528 stop:9929 length:402 start_codon:yes stop_codon:yes gene_type:complete
MAKLGAKAGWNNNYCESVTADKTLVAKDSGKVFIPSGAARTVTLPTVSSSLAGFHCTIISGDDSEHVISGGASLIYYHGSYGTDHASNTGRDIHETVSSLTLGAGAINDTIDISCDGTYWYCSGSTKATVNAA